VLTAFRFRAASGSKERNLKGAETGISASCGSNEEEMAKFQDEGSLVQENSGRDKS